MINRENMKEVIEQMNKEHQIEILRILATSKEICINENSNGTFINLTHVSDDVLKEVNNFINYVNNQQQQLSKIEFQREVIENKFFKNELNDPNTNSKEDIESNEVAL